MTRPTVVLKRFDQYFYKNATSTDPTLIPAAGAIITVFAQGATCVTDGGEMPSGSTADIDVYHTGSFDGTADAPNAATVYAADGIGIYPVHVWRSVGDEVLTMKNDAGAGDFTLFYGDRIVNTGRPLQVYRDGLATDAIGGDFVVEADGRARGYIAEYRYDFVVTPEAPWSWWIYIDAEGSFVTR